MQLFNNRLLSPTTNSKHASGFAPADIAAVFHLTLTSLIDVKARACVAVSKLLSNFCFFSCVCSVANPAGKPQKPAVFCKPLRVFFVVLRVAVFPAVFDDFDCGFSRPKYLLFLCKKGHNLTIFVQKYIWKPDFLVKIAVIAHIL